MLQEMKDMTNLTYTENGAVTYRSTMSECLDLFATIGALRNAGDSEILKRFRRAYAEDRDLAVKILFFARDVRGGLGERRVARIILKDLACHSKESVIKNIGFISEMGRWDDMLVLLDTPCHNEAIREIGRQLDRDLESMAGNQPVSLLAKWLPSINTSSHKTSDLGKKVAEGLMMSEREYRKTLSALRAYIKIIENSLRERDYTFDYGKQTSGSMFKYRKAFLRNDAERYKDFLNRVSTGEAVMHTGTLTPYEIIRPVCHYRGVLFAKHLSEEEKKAIDVTWNAQEDFTGDENAIVVVDGSGSMYGGNPVSPIQVAVSLGIYFAERNTGDFKDHFITFSCNPRLIEIKGKDIAEKVEYCMSYNECANTNIQKVFELILNAALEKGTSNSELPKKIYIISDMEFDWCAKDAGITNFEYAKELFRSNGYDLPEVVFWNVNSRNTQQPVKMNEQGVALVSGSTARVFEMIRRDILSPYQFMMDTLNQERYRDIVA